MRRSTSRPSTLGSFRSSSTTSGAMAWAPSPPVPKRSASASAPSRATRTSFWMLFLARARRVSASSSGLSSTSRIMRWDITFWVMRARCSRGDGGRSSVEHLPYLAGDGVRGERLLHVGGAGLEHAVPGDGIIGVARHEDHPGVGTQVGQPGGELAAVEAGHDDVREEKVYGARVAGRDVQRRLCTGGFEHGIAMAFEYLAGDAPHRGLILYHQHRLRSARGARRLVGRLGRPLRQLLDPWQVELEGGAMPDLAVHPDESAALLDDAVHGGEAQPRPFALLLGREERLEHVDLRLFTHPDARVRDREHDERAGASRVVVARVRFVQA